MPSPDKTSTPNADNLNWRDYEELVRDIHNVLGQDDGVEVVCWGTKCKVLGQSGIRHQVDVLTKHLSNVHECVTAIECKYWNKKVGLPELLKLAAVIDDAKLDRGVVVSKLGFTRPARKYAEYKEIGLIELRKPLDEDWEGRIRDIHGTITFVQSTIDDLRLALTAPESWIEERGLQEGPMSLTHLLDELSIRIANQGTKSLRQVTSEIQETEPGCDEYEFNFPEGSSVSVPNNAEHPINGCGITGVSFRVGFNPPIVQDISIRAMDHIYMIMESQFDGRRFTITTRGEIIENTSDDLA